MGHAGRNGVEQQVHLACGQVGDGLRRALVGHMGQLQARARREGRRVQVDDGPVAAAGVVEGARMGLGVGDQFLDAARGQRRRDQQDTGRPADLGNRREILVGLVGQTGHQVWRDGMRAAGGEQQRVAVRRGLGRLARADGAARAGAVVDDQLLAQVLGHALRHHARHEVGGAAGRKGHDQAHRMRGPGRLALCHGGQSDGASQGTGCSHDGAAWK